MNNHNYNLDEEITLFTFTQNDIKKLIKILSIYQKIKISLITMNSKHLNLI